MDLSQEIITQIVKYTPLVSIDLIIRNKSKDVLLGLRTNEPAKGSWFVPGGRIRKNEHISNAFSRISKFELGFELEFSTAKFLGVYEHLYAQNFAQVPDVSTHYVVLAYEQFLEYEMESFPLNQHSEFRWWSVDSILQSDLVHTNTKNYF
jgi:colanic acid biosynthesis protein WcaH